MEYVCGGGAASSCKSYYQYQALDKQNYTINVFDIVALSPALASQSLIYTPEAKNPTQLPLLIIIPAAKSKFFHSNVNNYSIPNFENYSSEKIWPMGIEIWKFNKCNF